MESICICNTPATSLMQEDGVITGVVSESEKYGKKVFQAGNVTLATGDFARSHDMNLDLAPETVGGRQPLYESLQV